MEKLMQNWLLFVGRCTSLDSLVWVSMLEKLTYLLCLGLSDKICMLLSVCILEPKNAPTIISAIEMPSAWLYFPSQLCSPEITTQATP